MNSSNLNSAGRARTSAVRSVRAAPGGAVTCSSSWAQRPVDEYPLYMRRPGERPPPPPGSGPHREARADDWQLSGLTDMLTSPWLRWASTPPGSCWHPPPGFSSTPASPHKRPSRPRSLKAWQRACQSEYRFMTPLRDRAARRLRGVHGSCDQPDGWGLCSVNVAGHHRGEGSDRPRSSCSRGSDARGFSVTGQAGKLYSKATRHARTAASPGCCPGEAGRRRVPQRRRRSGFLAAEEPDRVSAVP